MLIRIVLAAVAGLTLAGCDENLRNATYSDTQHLERNRALTFLHDTTLKTYSAGHGTQIEYLSADNEAILIYPGNTGIVYGEWAVRFTPNDIMTMCFRFQTNSYNPVTKVQGGNWECRHMNDFAAQLDELYDGDLFNLQGAVVPVRLKRDGQNISIPAALRANGFDQPTVPNKAPSAASYLVR